jgi:hypothetical protein
VTFDRRRLSSERAQISPRVLERLFVALAFHRVLGTLEREAFLFHDPPELIVAEARAGFLDQMRVQAIQGPNGEAVPQVLRRRLDNLPQGRSILGRRPRHTSRWLLSNQTY